ncbi:hypothetical protein BDZ89DRAFT_1069355 [Hymenopellis radicata]|nr:hypothetical protein BDZ89DRAFT_1069355 [Hymenopellis radicata]
MTCPPYPCCPQQKRANDVIDITELLRIAVARRLTFPHAHFSGASRYQFAFRHPESLSGSDIGLSLNLVRASSFSLRCW